MSCEDGWEGVSCEDGECHMKMVVCVMKMGVCREDGGCVM